MNIYEFYMNDSAYQGIIQQFTSKRELFEEMARQGIYDKQHLREIANQLIGNLRKNLAQHRENGINTHEEKMTALRNKKGNIGYAERQAEAKEFEVRFRIASDFELQQMTKDLTSTDLLELSLLQVELMNRKMNNEVARVKGYIQEHKLDGMTAEDEKTYKALNEAKKMYLGISPSVLLVDHKLVPLSSLQQELNAHVAVVPDDQPVKRAVSLERFAF